MNHDIAPCIGKNCPMRDKCRRYLAHVEATKLQIVQTVPYLSPRMLTLNNRPHCEDFWAEK